MNSSVTSKCKHFNLMQPGRECHCFLGVPTSDSYPVGGVGREKNVSRDNKKRGGWQQWGLRNPPNICYGRQQWTGPGSERRLGTLSLLQWKWRAPWWADLTQIDNCDKTTFYLIKPDKAKGGQVHCPSTSILATYLASCNAPCNAATSLSSEGTS